MLGLGLGIFDVRRWAPTYWYLAVPAAAACTGSALELLSPRVPARSEWLRLPLRRPLCPDSSAVATAYGDRGRSATLAVTTFAPC